MPIYTMPPEQDPSGPFGILENGVRSEDTLWRGRLASFAQAFTSNPTILAARVAAEATVEQGDHMSRETALQTAQLNGVDASTAIGEDGISEGALSFVIQHLQAEQKRSRLMEAAGTSGFTRGTLGLAAGFADPTNLIPFGEGFRASVGVEAAAKTFAGAAVRGAAEGAGVNALLEPLQYFGNRYGGDDHTMADAVTDVAMGGVFGGVMHVAGHAVGNITRPTTLDEHNVAGPLAAMQAAEDRPIDVTGVTDVRGDFQMPSEEDWRASAQAIQEAGFSGLSTEEITAKIKGVAEQLQAEGRAPPTLEEIQASLEHPQGPVSILGEHTPIGARPLEGGPAPRAEEAPHTITVELDRYLAERADIDRDYHAARISQTERTRRLDQAKAGKDAKLTELASGLKAGDVSDADFAEIARKLRDKYPALVKNADLDTFRAELKAEAERRVQKEINPTPEDREKLRAYQADAMDQALQRVAEKARAEGGPRTQLEGSGQRLRSRLAANSEKIQASLNAPERLPTAAQAELQKATTDFDEVVQVPKNADEETALAKELADEAVAEVKEIAPDTLGLDASNEEVKQVNGYEKLLRAAVVCFRKGGS